MPKKDKQISIYVCLLCLVTSVSLTACGVPQNNPITKAIIPTQLGSGSETKQEVHREQTDDLLLQSTVTEYRNNSNASSTDNAGNTTSTVGYSTSQVTSHNNDADYIAASITPELRNRADSVNIAFDVQGAGREIKSLYFRGVHIYDTAYLLSNDEKSLLESKIGDIAKETGFAVAAFTVSEGNSGAASIEDLADMIYYYSGLGTGVDKDGVILLIDMYSSNVYIYTHGSAIRYMTDAKINYIYDDLNGGLFSSLTKGYYANACNIFADGVLEAYRGGVSPFQYNYDTQTGERDPYIVDNVVG